MPDRNSKNKGGRERAGDEREREREREREGQRRRERRKKKVAAAVEPRRGRNFLTFFRFFFFAAFALSLRFLCFLSAFSEQRALLSYSSRSYQKLRASLRTRPKESFSGGPLSRKREAAFPFSILFSFAIVELQKKTRKRGFSFASLAPNLPSSHSFHSHNEERLKQPALL